MRHRGGIYFWVVGRVGLRAIQIGEWYWFLQTRSTNGLGKSGLALFLRFQGTAIITSGW